MTRYFIKRMLCGLGTFLWYYVNICFLY
uniref:Uncharacterized protein n=1 Tax=Anguilla anguilla TaxID=7936 RepID=A0A0E9V6S5_ANGAN